jgi:hypothetical protein
VDVAPLPNPASSRRWLLGILAVLFLLLDAQSSPAYSVLTHEQVVELLWKAQIRPMLVARYPDATEEQIRTAHAYAYGGCLIQDIGYYPFGNRFFSDLVHYVRSGDFVSTMLTRAADIDEYAFALGALAHYASDIAGHPAVNLAVGETFPKLQSKYGASVTYADDPTAHVRTEFGFDVVQVAHDRFTSQAFHDFIGFEVSEPLLQRAFLSTYGLTLDDAFPNLDLAIGTFRYSVSRLIPQMTRVALAMKKDEILKEDPTVTREKFLYHLRASEYRRDWGSSYRRPNFLERFLAFFIGLLPKIGPLRALDFKMPTAHTENLYMQSVLDSSSQYGKDLTAAAGNALRLDNKDFDTGNETKAGEYSLTDQTYADLLNKLAADHFAHLTPELQANLLGFYQGAPLPAFAHKHRGEWTKTQASLAALRALSVPVATRVSVP